MQVATAHLIASELENAVTVTVERIMPMREV
jgi:hypothetical protein